MSAESKMIPGIQLCHKVSRYRNTPLNSLFLTDPNRHKDDSPLPANNCYEPDPVKYKLVIRDVGTKHSGNYTILLNNTKHGLFKKLAIQLVVLGKLFVVLNPSFVLVHYQFTSYLQRASRTDES